jgi:hypothetical protein
MDAVSGNIVLAGALDWSGPLSIAAPAGHASGTSTVQRCRD